jgi:cytochrome c peroxidase
VNPFNSKFDLFLDGKVGLSDTEARGYALFTGKANCFRCHELSNPDRPGVKPLFTNFGHQNLGAPANPDHPFYNLPSEYNPDGKNYVDLGLGAVVKDPKENGKFKIPSLRNVAVTPPYEHNGVFKTLREVVMFNNTRDLPGSNYPPAEVAENVHRHNPAEMHGGGNMAQPPSGHVKRMHGFTPMPGTLGQLGLTDAEVDDIVAFLGTLTDGYQLP